VHESCACLLGRCAPGEPIILNGGSNLVKPHFDQQEYEIMSCAS
jgi:hypothetical protein